LLVRLSFELKDYLHLNIIPVIRQHFGSEALGYAVKMEFLARNVAEAVDPPHPEHTNMATLAPDDISTFLATAKKTHYYTLFDIALFTRMRRGELLALTWANIDLDMATISVTQMLHRLSNGQYVIRQPKSSKSRRQVDLPPTLALLLRQYEAEQELEKNLSG